MALYTRDSIERLREAIDMVALVGQRTDLRQRGARWMGLCPFHEERTPSFSVDPERRLYHCFGCGAGGDAIKFVEETEAVDFREAVELLAERHGVELKREREDPEEEQRRRRRERLLALLDRAARFYESYLWDSGEAAPARDYLVRTRRLSEEVLRRFGVGFAPGAWDRLCAAAGRDGVGAEELIAAGLAQPGRRGGPIDRFRARIMFPLSDGRGRVLGFGARALEGGRGPKYLNTSENELYKKGRQLFGLHQAAPHASRAARVVVVEGYTDVLALHQAGVEETVAIMGTAVTDEQVRQLTRAVGAGGTVLLALDADRAGQEAMLRAAAVSRGRDVDLRVVDLPRGRDPADLVADGGAEAFTERAASSLPVLEFQVRRVVADADLDSPAGRDRALQQVHPLISATPPDQPVLRDHLIRLVADRLDVPTDYLTAQLRGARRARAGGPAAAGPAASRLHASAAGGPPRAGASSAAASPALAAERAFLALCLASGRPGRESLEELRPEHLSSQVARAARDRLVARFDDPLAGLEEAPAEVGELVARAVAEAAEMKPASESALRADFLKLELRRIEREIRHARQQGDLGAQSRLASAWQEVRQELGLQVGQTA